MAYIAWCTEQKRLFVSSLSPYYSFHSSLPPITSFSKLFCLISSPVTKLDASLVNRQQLCLCQKSAFVKNSVCDLDHWTHDLEHVISSSRDCSKWLCTFWLKFILFRRSAVIKFTRFPWPLLPDLHLWSNDLKMWSVSFGPGSVYTSMSMHFGDSCVIKGGLVSAEPMAIEASCQRAGWQMTGRGQKNDVSDTVVWYAIRMQWYTEKLPINWAEIRATRMQSNRVKVCLVRQGQHSIHLLFSCTTVFDTVVVLWLVASQPGWTTTNEEVAILIPGESRAARSIVVHVAPSTVTRAGSQVVSVTHRSRDPLCYVLLFLYGTDAFHWDIPRDGESKSWQAYYTWLCASVCLSVRQSVCFKPLQTDRQLHITTYKITRTKSVLYALRSWAANANV